MASRNEFRILGNLVADPEQFGSAVKIRVATNYKTKDGEEKAEFHRITCFGKTGESVMKFCKKGKQLDIDGRISYSTYEKDGKTQYSTDLVADRVNFLGGGAKSEEEAPF
jgi:single-strand DNA-binding protein